MRVSLHVMTSTEDLSRILEEELSRFTIPGSRDAFATLLCTPRLELRVWDWNRGQVVPVWIVACVNDTNLLFAYSREGYVDPWGVLSSTDNLLGMDAQWCRYLEDAFVSSGAWKGPSPADFEIR